ncbi:hypothetical protein AY599_23060 [Leptolyngbya valderiana BDU 20041]|nr:hypothetical protein [Geitlerinema sp. CS-897]OAB63501.1 hypothetical protein AY599_23060 [Leptolyngbya valderiana BDU 20041]PPT06667.1 hypothetical protein CKA32_005306 [Geitlerinema sp. FC II]
MSNSLKFNCSRWLSIAGCAIVVGISGAIDSANAQTSADPCRDPNANIELCPPQRLRPTFSEEESRGFEERGFSESFLGDALNGIADPLGSGTVGGGQLENESFRDLSPVDRGFIPAFDPTDVIIPIPAITDSDCCSN